MVVQDLYNIAE